MAALRRLHAVVFWPWTALLVATAIAGWATRRSSTGWISEAAELGLLSLAALLLPPFLTFGIYFCLFHAVRHMGSLSSQAYPMDLGKALLFAGKIILPLAVVCCSGLILFSDQLAGTFRTPALVRYGLQLLAALTVPHMVLEFVCWLDAKRP